MIAIPKKTAEYFILLRQNSKIESMSITIKTSDNSTLINILENIQYFIDCVRGDYHFRHELTIAAPNKTNTTILSNNITKIAYYAQYNCITFEYEKEPPFSINIPNTFRPYPNDQILYQKIRNFSEIKSQFFERLCSGQVPKKILVNSEMKDACYLCLTNDTEYFVARSFEDITSGETCTSCKIGCHECFQTYLKREDSDFTCFVCFKPYDVENIFQSSCSSPFSQGSKV